MTGPVSTAPQLDWLHSEGAVEYPAALETMRTRVAGIRSGQIGEQVWFLEHPPLYTAGSSARPGDLTEPGRFQHFDAGRGGQWTYHGPGQVVAYVMLDLDRPHGTIGARDTHAYVGGLETWLRHTLARFGVNGQTRPGRIGIWVTDPSTGAENKIAAIGVRITRWVSWHGVAVNVCPDLEHFSGIVPCGIREHGVTSLRALGLAATMQEVRTAMRASWDEVFG